MWAFGSPSLVISTEDTRWQSDEWCSWRALELAGVMENPHLCAELETFLAREKDHRLGARFEALIEYGLNLLPAFESVCRRLQVQDGGRTLGEFDFLVRAQETDTLEHWEVASKFYLGVPHGDSLDWVGPGKRDSLVRKLNHLNTKQLELSLRPEAATTVQAVGDIPGRVRALLKGRLFYPLQSSQAHDHAFRFSTSAGEIRLNARAPTGFWCDFAQCSKAAPEQVFALEKHQWLDPSPERGTAIELTALERNLTDGPQCVDVIRRDGSAQRWFVVAPGWFDDLDAASLV